MTNSPVWLCCLLHFRRIGGTDFYRSVYLIERERTAALLRDFDQCSRAGRRQILLAGLVVRDVRRRLPEYVGQLTLLHAQGETDGSEIGCHGL